VVDAGLRFFHHRGTEDTEVTQRKLKLGHYYRLRKALSNGNEVLLSDK